MNAPLFTDEMKLADIIHLNYRLLLLFPRLGMNLGFGDKTVKEWCESSAVSPQLFLMICNVYNCEQYLPGEQEIEEIDVNQLILTFVFALPIIGRSLCLAASKRAGRSTVPFARSFLRVSLIFPWLSI